jgi:hypothetical protein
MTRFMTRRNGYRNGAAAPGVVGGVNRDAGAEHHHIVDNRTPLVRCQQWFHGAIGLVATLVTPATFDANRRAEVAAAEAALRGETHRSTSAS